MPDRHIFRVDSDGGAHATGQTAPREPSRAIAPWNRKAGHVAVEAPPPSLRAPDESSDVKVTTPSRRRRTGGAPAAATGRIESARMTALPAPADDAKPKRATRTRAAGETAPLDAPMTRALRAPRKAAAKTETVAEPAPRAAAAKKTAVKKTSTAKKATSAKAATAVKKTSTRKKK